MILPSFLEQLLLTPSPTGAEEKIQSVVRKEMAKYTDHVVTDVHGNVLVGVNPGASRKILLAGHCDQIGFAIKKITKDGFIAVAPLGGIDPAVMPGSHIIFTGSKGPVRGVVGRKAIHLQSAGERDNLKLDMDKFIIDIGAKNQKEAESVLSVGDVGTYELKPLILRDKVITSTGLDDKVGVYVVMETIKRLAKQKLQVGVFAASTVQEEIGTRGVKTVTHALNPEIGIAVDVTHSYDTPVTADVPNAPSVKIGGGPVLTRGPNINPRVHELMVEAAKQEKLKVQLEVSTKPLSNDAREIQISRDGVATHSIGLPLRFMHTSSEVMQMSDIENAITLLTRFCKLITADTELRPGMEQSNTKKASRATKRR